MNINLNLVQRITLGFLLIIGIMSVATWTANAALEDSKLNLERATNVESTKIRDVARMVQQLIALQRSEKNLILSKTPMEMDEYSKAILVEDSILRGLLSTTKGLVSITEGDLLEDFEAEYDTFRLTQQQVISLTRDNANVKARELSQGGSRVAYDIAATALKNVITINDIHAEKVNNAILSSGSIVRLSARTVQDLLAITRAERNIILSQTQVEMDEYASFISTTRREMQMRREQLRELVDNEGKIILDIFSDVWEQFLEVDRQVRDLTRENGNNKARALSQGDARIYFDATIDTLHDLAKLGGGENPHFQKLIILIERNLVTLQRGEKNLILARSDEEMGEYIATIKISQVDLINYISQLSILVDDDDVNFFNEFKKVYLDYLDLHKEVLRFSLLNSNVKAFHLASNEGRLLADESEQLLAQLTDKNNREYENLLTNLTRINKKSKLASQVNILLAEMQRGEKNIILSTSQSEMGSYSSSLITVRTDLESKVKKMSKLFVEEYLGDQATNVLQDLSEQRLTEFYVAYKNYQGLNDEVRSMSRRNSNVRALALSAGAGRVQFDLAEGILKDLVKMVDYDMAQNLTRSNNQLHYSQSITYVVFTIAVLFALGLAYAIARHLTSRARLLALNARKLAVGDLIFKDDSCIKFEVIDEFSPVDDALYLINQSNNQIIQMTKALSVGEVLQRLTPRSDHDPLIAAINKMADSSAEVVIIANAIAVGDLTLHLHPRSEGDTLANALNQMVDNSAEVAILANSIASGDLSNQLLVRSDQDQLSLALNRMLISLRSATESKDRFLSSMSHELRTPLNAIIGLSSVLASGTSKISPAKQSEYISAIYDSGQHLLQIIGDILDISKLDAGARTLENAPFTVLEALDVCHKTFNFACQDKDINLVIDNQLNGACPVIGDITVLKQILFNLLSNAIKFTEVGSVSLTAALQAASESDPNQAIIFTVSDTGKGIHPDAIPQLFQAFKQEDESVARSFGGSGLGLHISQRLAQLMKGQINCTSSVGHGSTFEVVVYLEQQSKVSVVTNVDKKEFFNLPPLKLLVVDDSELNIMVAAAMLEPKGHTVEAANSGRQAVEMASNNDYDAILMDIHMPDLNGIKATVIIRNIANKQRADVPIIALTADVDVKQQAKFISAGMNSSLGKPWLVKDLEKELGQVLNLI